MILETASWAHINSVRQPMQMGWGRSTSERHGRTLLLYSALAWLQVRRLCFRPSMKCYVPIAKKELKKKINKKIKPNKHRKRKSIASVLMKDRIIYKSLHSWSIQTTTEKREKTVENYHPYHKGNNPCHKANTQHFSIKACRSRGNIIKLVGDI